MPTDPDGALAGFTRRRFTYDGRERTVFRRGDGPGVIVMSEVPGITPAVAGFARRVADRGFTVDVPDLFGTPGRSMTPLYVAQTLSYACISQEFELLSTERASPITEWLRGLARALHVECGGPGVGAVGMCLTGNFALALMLDPCMQAPVLSQPSLPFPLGAARARAVHLSRDQLRAVRHRSRTDGVPVLGLRFTGDPMCPRARFDTLRRELGANFRAVEIDSGLGNRHGIRRLAHSVLTEDLVDREGHPTRAALDQVLAFFAERLKGD